MPLRLRPLGGNYREGGRKRSNNNHSNSQHGDWHSGKYHATLFEKFNQARRPGIKGEPSVGLGMSIIKTIVE
ncbi:hypothetical protein [Adhaeribacter arboris]|uniref:hypothetical protein n=1 Tax=Adhaeribacter arboris TaxID=2072846 RepID=UPI0011B2505A|nr:hypothetical protein [Adhaeribacter arboris]